MPLYARDVMNEELITVRPENTRQEVIDLFQTHRISGAPVVDGRGVLIGVITLKDLLASDIGTPYETNYFFRTLEDHHFDEAQLQRVAGEGFVSDYLNRTVFTAYPNTTLAEIAQLMLDHKIHRLIITKPHTQIPIGIVTTFDLLKVLAQLHPADKILPEEIRLNIP